MKEKLELKIKEMNCESCEKAISKIVSKFVNVALPENQVYTKVIEMPILSDKELSSAIFWEAEQNIPVPLSTITLAWNVLKRPQKAIGNEKMHVLMVGAPSVLVNKYQKVLLMAGLRINALETELLSIIRALVLSENFANIFLYYLTFIYNQ